MQSHSRWYAVSLAVLSVASTSVSCAGDEQASSHVAPVPASSVVSDLDQADREETCEAAVMAFQDASSTQTRARVSCLKRVVPLTYALDGSIGLDIPACDALLERCLAGEAFPDPDPHGVQVSFVGFECDQSLLEWLGSCDATVGEFESCFVALGPVVERRQSMLTCGSLSSTTSPGSMQSTPEFPPECDALRGKCSLE